MAVPNFLDKLTGKKESNDKTFLALVLSDHRVQAAVWKVGEKGTEIVSLGTPVEWDGEVATTSELISAVDATISSATEGFDLEPDEIVLGLANAWVDNSGIKQSKKDLIKSICRELSLKPIGYVVIADTIVKYLKMEEGSPPTSLLIQIDRRSITLSLVELGNIKYTIQVGASDNISSDVAEGITRLPKDISLPSRFILVSAMENTSDLVQTLTAYDWQKSFDFLHTPKIEALPKDVEVHATAVAGGSEVAASLGFSLESNDSQPKVEVEEPESAADFGFLPTSASEVTATLKPSDAVQHDSSNDPIISGDVPAILDEPDEDIDVVTPKPAAKFKLPSLPSFKPNFKFNYSRLPHFSLGKGNRSMLIIVLTIFAVFGLFAAYYYVPTATLNLTIQAKPITETINITLSSTATKVDLDNSTIPATYSTKEISGEETTPVTGKKTIGDPSRGEVTIYNRTSLPKTLLKGTTLSSNSLKFTLDSDVTVASKSAGVDYVDVPGKANVKITASTFGSNGNLKSGTEFTIASFTKDSFVAKNETNLSGGTAEEVSVVSETDKATLLKNLKSKLGTELKESLLPDQSSTESFFVIDGDAKVVAEKYSSRVGDAADSLSAEITLSIGVLSYNQDDIQTLVKNTIVSSIPNGYHHTEIPPTINLRDTKLQENEDLRAAADVTLYVVEAIDTKSIADTVKGKKYSEAISFLSSIPGITKTQIALSPNLPPRLMSIPHNVRRITINLMTSK